MLVRHLRQPQSVRVTDVLPVNTTALNDADRPNCQKQIMADIRRCFGFNKYCVGGITYRMSYLSSCSRCDRFIHLANCKTLYISVHP